MTKSLFSKYWRCVCYSQYIIDIIRIYFIFIYVTFAVITPLCRWGQQRTITVSVLPDRKFEPEVRRLLLLLYVCRKLHSLLHNKHDGGDRRRNKPWKRQTGVVSFHFTPDVYHFCVFCTSVFIFIQEKTPRTLVALLRCWNGLVWPVFISRGFFSELTWACFDPSCSSRFITDNQRCKK